MHNYFLINYIYSLIITCCLILGGMWLASKFTKNSIVQLKTRPIYILLLAFFIEAFLFYR